MKLTISNRSFASEKTKKHREKSQHTQKRTCHLRSSIWGIRRGRKHRSACRTHMKSNRKQGRQLYKLHGHTHQHEHISAHSIPLADPMLFHLIGPRTSTDGGYFCFYYFYFSVFCGSSERFNFRTLRRKGIFGGVMEMRNDKCSTAWK